MPSVVWSYVSIFCGQDSSEICDLCRLQSQWQLCWIREDLQRVDALTATIHLLTCGSSGSWRLALVSVFHVLHLDMYRRTGLQSCIHLLCSSSAVSIYNLCYRISPHVFCAAWVYLNMLYSADILRIFPRGQRPLFSLLPASSLIRRSFHVHLCQPFHPPPLSFLPSFIAARVSIRSYPIASFRLSFPISSPTFHVLNVTVNL